MADPPDRVGPSGYRLDPLLGPSHRASAVADLCARIAAGGYLVPSDDVAAAMVDSALRDLTVRDGRRTGTD